MKYLKGRFVENLQVAMKYRDSDMIMDLFADQITDIALKRPDALQAALKNAGISVSDSLDPKYLVALVADNWSNKKLLQNISLMIADLNNVVSASGDFLNDATGAGDIVRGLGDIVKGAAEITTAAMQPGIEKQKNKGKMFDFLSAKAGAKAEIVKAQSLMNAESLKHKSTLTYALVGVAVIAVIGIGIYAYKQSLITTPA